MKYFAIRDEDVGFFTSHGVLEKLYGTIYQRVPVSFACVSRTVPQYLDEVCFAPGAASGTYALGENRALVDYLRRLQEKRQCEILVHGYTHEGRAVNGKWQAEFVWKSREQSTEDISAACEYLTSLFGVRPRVFVPPGNDIGRSGAEAVTAAGLDLSAQISWRPDRPWSRGYVDCYRKRWMYSLAKRKPYPLTLEFGTHKELVAYSLDSMSDFEDAVANLRACAQADAPFVLATHYWKLAADEGLHSTLLRVIDEALDLGYLPATVADAIAGKRQAPNLRVHSAARV